MGQNVEIGGATLISLKCFKVDSAPYWQSHIGSFVTVLYDFNLLTPEYICYSSLWD